jgi:hypothetical protein
MPLDEKAVENEKKERPPKNGRRTERRRGWFNKDLFAASQGRI